MVGKVLIHRDDEKGLKDPNINLGEYVGKGILVVNADSRLDDNDLIHVGNIEFKVIHTPGHTCRRSKPLFRKRKTFI